VVFNAAPMESLISATVGRPRLYAALLSAFAAVGVTLAVIGVYGVIASGVAQRTREIGVRMALGARQRDVMTMVLRVGLVLTLTGIVFGVAGAFATTRVLDTLLFEMTPLDPMVFAGAGLLFVVTAVLASLIPARRAARVDPLVALRAD
jgi:ABC-type antimicrobial peptide transport system permease subunit